MMSTAHIEKICLGEFRHFIRRNRRYLVTCLAIYFYSLFAWRRMRLLRAGHCLAQHIDDVLDGDRLVDVPALVYVDDLLRQIQTGGYDLTAPIPTLTCFVFTEADVATRTEFLALIKTLCFDRQRTEARLQLSKNTLDQQHCHTFEHSMNISLMMTGSPLRAADVPEMVAALSWVSPMRDLREDLQHGLINIPLEVLEQARCEGVASLDYDLLVATPAVRAWMRQEYKKGRENLAALPKRLLSLWNKRGALEIFAFFLEIKRYSIRYARLYKDILDGGT
jgi:hypothetical protein